MKQDKAHTVAFIGVMAALMFVVLALETYIFIYFIKPSPAFISIPLFLALSMYGDWKRSFLGGTLFGVCSFLLSFLVGYTVFFNPLISVLPRVIAGVLAYLIYAGLSALTRGRGDAIVCALSAALAVILHTVLVLGAMQLFSEGGAFVDTVWQTIIGLNFAVELVCAVLLVPVFVRVLRRMTHARPPRLPDNKQDSSANDA